MKLTEKNREILLEYINKRLIDISRSNAEEFVSKNKRFKPFGIDEENAIYAMKENPKGFLSLMEKVLWHSGHDLLFDLFCIIDGVGDPDDRDWKGVLLIDLPDDFDNHVEFLHDGL